MPGGKVIMKRIRSAAPGLLVLGLLVLPIDARADSPAPEIVAPQALTITEPAGSLSPVELQAVLTSNEFGFGLLRHLYEGREDESANVFVSPLSVSMSLGMLLNGAAGETFDAMGNTLGLDGLTVGEANDVYQNLIESLVRMDSSVELRLANHSWLDESFQIRRDYRSRVQVFFDAQIENVHFDEPDVARDINGWVSASTAGRISEMVTPEDFGGLVALLVNSVYFDAEWADPFDPSETVMVAFRRADGSTVSVATMRQELDARVGGGEDYGQDFVAIDLPYGGATFSMTVVVPVGDATLSELVDGMDEERWQEVVDALRGEARTEVRLPRFELEYEEVLNDVLKAMGMEVAFDGRKADFGWLNGNAGLGAVPHIGSMKQKSFLRVDEQGTETAAATGTAFTTSENPALQADRPFLFAIRERQTGAILFLGTVTDPTS